MKVRVNRELVDHLKSWICDQIKGKQPRLCLEIDSLQLSHAIDLAGDFVSDWRSEAFFLQGTSEGQSCFLLVDVDAFRDEAKKMLANEGTISVTDIASTGGCTIDVSENDEGGFAFLIVAWGECERRLAAFEPNYDFHRFRGN